MLPSNRVILAPIVLLLAALACTYTDVPVPTVGPEGIGTFIEGTVASSRTQSAVAQISLPSAVPTETPTLTFTPEPPTSTPTATLSPTPIFTPTPLVPFISVSVPTNCRNGPGKVYGYVGALLVGESAQVFARDPTNNYWYIRNPDSSGNDYCWLWGNYATLTGNFAALPVYTPPPTPTPTFTPTPSPSFTTSFLNLDRCGKDWWIDLRITNDGSVAFKSVEIAVRDRITDVLLWDLADGFADVDGCTRTTTQGVIAPGETYLLSSPAFDYDPTGHNIRVTLTLCSETGQRGICFTQNFGLIP